MKLYAIRIGTIRMRNVITGTVAEATGRYRTVEYATTKAMAIQRAKAIRQVTTHPQGGWQVVEATVPDRLSKHEWCDCLSYDCPGESGFFTFTDFVELGKVVEQFKP